MLHESGPTNQNSQCLIRRFTAYRANDRCQRIEPLVSADQKFDDIEPLTAHQRGEFDAGRFRLDPGIPAIATEELADQREFEHQVTKLLGFARRGRKQGT